MQSHCIQQKVKSSKCQKTLGFSARRYQWRFQMKEISRAKRQEVAQYRLHITSAVNQGLDLGVHGLSARGYMLSNSGAIATPWARDDRPACNARRCGCLPGHNEAVAISGAYLTPPACSNESVIQSRLKSGRARSYTSAHSHKGNSRQSLDIDCGSP
jgi:hypothetical protein